MSVTLVQAECWLTADRMSFAQYKLPLRKCIVTNVQQLAKLAEISAHCEHFIKDECLDSQLLNGPGSTGYMHDWWVSRDGRAMTYWGGGIILLVRVKSITRRSALWMQL